MNKFIEKELNSCRVAKIPMFNEDTTHMVIYKSNSNMNLFKEEDNSTLRLNGYYLIQFASYIIDEPEGFTLSKDWNNGTKPLTRYNKVQVVQISGKMVKLDCVGFDFDNQRDLNNIWSGWVPAKMVQIIRQIE